MKIALITAKKLLSEADDIWIDMQSVKYSVSTKLPMDEAFFEAELEDVHGLVLEYSAAGADNIAVGLSGCALSLVGRDADGDAYEFDVMLLKKWDAEKYINTNE